MAQVANRVGGRRDRVRLGFAFGLGFCLVALVSHIATTSPLRFFSVYVHIYINFFFFFWVAHSFFLLLFPVVSFISHTSALNMRTCSTHLLRTHTHIVDWHSVMRCAALFIFGFISDINIDIRHRPQLH